MLAKQKKKRLVIDLISVVCGFNYLAFPRNSQVVRDITFDWTCRRHSWTARREPPWSETRQRPACAARPGPSTGWPGSGSSPGWQRPPWTCTGTGRASREGRRRGEGCRLRCCCHRSSGGWCPLSPAWSATGRRGPGGRPTPRTTAHCYISFVQIKSEFTCECAQSELRCFWGMTKSCEIVPAYLSIHHCQP